MIAYSSCTGCKIHEGFYNAYRSVSSKVTDHLNILLGKYPDAKIIVTGHSLGAAIATITGNI